MNALKTSLLLGGLTLLFIYIGGVLGGQQGMIFAFVMALVMNFGTYYFSDKIVLRMYNAREVTESEAPWLHSTVRQLALRAQIPSPKIYIIPGETPNAFATGRNPEHAAVAVTEGIMSILDKDELAGVLAHEIAHVKNRDILIGSIAATVAGAISMLVNFMQYALIFGGGNRNNENGGHPALLLVSMILAPIAAMLIQMAISRTREYQADATGAQLVGNGNHLANALLKLHQAGRVHPMNASPATAHMFIVNPLTGGGLMSLFSTHPPMEKRVAALREMRSFS